MANIASHAASEAVDEVGSKVSQGVEAVGQEIEANEIAQAGGDRRQSN